MLTLKIGKTLEAIGKKGKIALIDGAPKQLQKLATDYLPQNYTEETVQNSIMMNIIYVCFPDDNGVVAKEILGQPSWKDKINKLTDLYKDKKLYSEEYGVKICHALVNRMILTINIDVDSFDVIQHSPLTLIRPTELSVQEIEEDYGLNKCSSNAIDIKYLEGNHATVLENPKLPVTLNSI